jgi:UPF0755 protein
MKLTRRGKILVILTLLFLLVAMPAAAGFVYLRSLGLVGSSAPGEQVEVEIPEGSGAADIGRLLETESVIRSAFGFRIALYLDGGGADIQAGTYELPTGLTARDALAALKEGPVVRFVTVTIPEGAWLTDFARIVGRETHVPAGEFRQLAESGEIRSKYQPDDVDSLEGLLFPATYQVVEQDDAESLVRRLVEEFDARMDGLDFSRLSELGVTEYEAVVIASMVEAEARVPRERGMIARVIYNRLEAGDRLGIDATVLYAIGEHKETLTVSDLQTDSPYNTRKVAGLPRTPIGAPGVASLEAAVNPADGDWLYYVVSDCAGHHAFSESYDEFLQNKAKYQALECP